MRTRFVNNLLSLYVGFAVLAALLIAVFAFVSKQAQDYHEVRQFAGTRQALHRYIGALQDAESGQRGYLLTNEPAYLEIYKRAVPRVAANFEELRRSISGGDEELASLRAAAEPKLEQMRYSVELQSTGKHDEALAIVGQGRGKMMERIRAETEALILREEQRINERSKGFAAVSGYLRLGAVGAVAMVALVGFAAIRQMLQQLKDIARARDELREANAALSAEAAQKEKLSAQLRQSQKMEALGQLTGGLAHDFNNMLAVIIGSINLAKRRLSPSETKAAHYLDSALEGAQRAATLTHRLLAFSRQQPLSPEPIDPNKMMASMAEMLRHTLGEMVQLEAVFAGGLWRAHVDPSQLETAILNLALNARDAMPEGGKLTIETNNAFLDEEYSRETGAPPGAYVLIAVTDTGTGMSREVMERAFDPFFTTKPIGKGTGLGLSQVFGFVRQSGGHLKIYSEPGLGTTVKIYLPRHQGSAEKASSASTVPRPIPPGATGETILVVEDDEHVRRLTFDTLVELGYRVLQAEAAATALRHIEADTPIDLLFTDIVMPDTNGRKLADEARQRRPELRVLFTTGYTRNAIVHNGVLDSGVDLIAKPYSIDQLARKLREVLDRPSKTEIASEPVSSGRILVVDDDSAVAESMAALLRLDNHDVVLAQDGPGALIAAQSFKPQIVLLDLGLPGMDGHHVAQRLRAAPDGRGFLLIALTGSAGDHVEKQCAASGFDHHLVKPTDLDALKILVDTHLSRSARATTTS